ncbi:phosphotransferase [Chloroflexota bacterium]
METIVETIVVEKEGETIIIIVEQETEDEAPAAEAPAEVEEEAPALAPTATQAPLGTAADTQPAPSLPVLSATPLVEACLVEVEWPESMYLGDSDVVRMALIPSEDGYLLTTEFPDHTTITQDVPVVRPEGYDLLAIGRLDGVGFSISPSKEQASSLPLDQPVTWHWSLTPVQPGQQRLTVSLLLRWEPLPATSGVRREAVAYSKGLDMRVNSFFGLTRRQTLTTALVGLALGSSLILLAAASGLRFGGQGKASRDQTAQIRKPNRRLEIEAPAGLMLDAEDENLLRSLFQPYRRLIIQQEFLSGYSGSRTFLLVPIRTDDRADAPTIAKLGPRSDIEREYANYETFVKRTLPPVTARIQAAPVTIRKGVNAALQYTFIGHPGTQPVSLRQFLLDDPDPKMLSRIFETFGPNWWMQRKPWTFRFAQEYDCLLPPHWTLEPDTGKGKGVDGNSFSPESKLSIGDLVSPRNFKHLPSGSRQGYSNLTGQPTAGQPAMRLRWLSEDFPRSAVGRVRASRMDILRSYVGGYDLLGLPDPLEKLPELLDETVNGTRSIIHGDLNLENILIGPGGMVWMIDFATTRMGHPLMDFAHLETEIIAHLIAPQIVNAYVFVAMLELEGVGGKPQVSRDQRPVANNRSQVQQSPISQVQYLLSTLHEMAFKCLSNPVKPREYWLALYISCIGALKYRNLDENQKYYLYLAAAYLAQYL